MAYIGRDTDKISNVEVLDNITFDGSSSYTLQKGGSNFTPSSANTLLVSIDGVVQAGNFTVSGSTIDFGTAVAGTSTCDFVLHYGVGLITTPSDGTVTTAKLGDSSVTTAKLNDASVSLAKLTATGTKDATTFLRGDNTFATVSSSMVTAYAEITSSQTVASSSLVDLTGATVTVTPSSTSSKFLIVGRVACQPSSGFGLAILRGATNIFESLTAAEVYPVNQNEINPFMYIDAPNTTSATTYKIQVKTYTGDTGLFQGGGTSNICVVEILG